MFPILETDRLFLRNLVAEDKDAIFRLFSNDDVTRYYGIDAFTNIEQAE